jgi:hypothetical protein
LPPGQALARSLPLDARMTISALTCQRKISDVAPKDRRMG